MNLLRRRWKTFVAGALALLLIAGVIGVQVLDGYLLRRARAEADALSTRLGRPLSIGGLSTRLFTGLGVRVRDVELGAAPGESLPLARVGYLDVQVALLPALRSRGRDLQVRSVEVGGLEVNVLALADGTTNVDRTRERLASTAPPPGPKEAKEASGTDLSALRVDRVELVGGLVRFKDASGEVAISRLNARADGLRAGAPLALRLTAAVLQERENLELNLRTTPLDRSLRALPEKVTLTLSATDLTPLGRFLPQSAAFSAGTLAIDLAAELKAVGADAGLTLASVRLAGTARGTGFKFVEAKGGRALDTSLDVDLSGDLVRGDLDIRKLSLDFGPATVRGSGRVQGLLTDAPAVQGLTVVGKDLDPSVLAGYYPPLAKQLPGELAGPIGLTLRASGTQAAPAVKLELDLTPVALVIPGQLTKGAGAPMRWTAEARASGAGSLAFSVSADLSGADLRPGGRVNKPAGGRLAFSTAGTYKRLRVGAAHVEVKELTAQVLGDVARGAGFIQTAPRQTKFDLRLASDQLDLDRLLLEREAPRKEGKAGDEAGADAAKNGGAQDDAGAYAGLDGRVTVRIGRLVSNELELRDVVAVVTLKDDLVTLETGHLGVYGGKVDASGSSMRLAGDAPPFVAKVRAQEVDLARVLESKARRDFLSGAVDLNLEFTGSGLEKVDLLQSLAGAAQGSVTKGTWVGTDLLPAITGPLGQALPFAAKQLPALDGMALGRVLPFSVRVEEGVARLKQPLNLERPGARFTLDGGIHLDGRLAMTGTVSIEPAIIEQLTQGRARPRAPIPLRFELSGPAWSPTVSGLDLRPAVQTIVQQAASGAATRLLGDKGKVVEKVLESKPEEVRRAAEEAAAEQRRLAEQRAREELERQKKKAEDKAGKALRGLFGR